MDLINALIRPSGARIILDILQRLALIDKDLDDAEKDLIQDFADRWKIKIDFRRQFEIAAEHSTEQMYIELRNRVSDYLSVSPERNQTTQFLDIINLLIGIDQSVSPEEQLIVDEITGMIETYINDGQAQRSFGVVIVPQDEKGRAAIETLLPNVKPRAGWGGNVYLAGTFHSRGYAEMMSERYQGLSLFSTVKAL